MGRGPRHLAAKGRLGAERSTDLLALVLALATRAFDGRQLIKERYAPLRR